MAPENSDLPPGWRTAKIEDIAVMVGSGSTPKGGNSSYVREGVPLIRSQNVHDGGLRLDDVAHITEATHAKMKRTHLRDLDVLLNITGASIGRCTFLPQGFGPGNVNQHVCIIRLDQRTAAAAFLSAFLSSYQGQRQIQDLQAGLSREGLNFQQVRAIRLPLPPLAEQRKIAAILSSVDEVIEKTQAVIDQVQVVKKGLVQELLTRGLPGRHAKFKKTEIGEIPESWDVHRLDSVAMIQTGIAKNRKNAGNISVPYLRVANVQDGFLDLTEVKTIDVNEQALSRYEVRVGDVLFTEGGDADKLGRGTVWSGELSPCVHQNHVFVVRPGARVRSWFLTTYGGSDRGKAYFLDCAKQTTNLASINSSQLRAFPIPLPPVEEQDAILSRTRAVEGCLAVERAAHEQLVRVKQSLMSVLLTGEVRVNVEEQAVA